MEVTVVVFKDEAAMGWFSTPMVFASKAVAITHLKGLGYKQDMEAIDVVWVMGRQFAYLYTVQVRGA